MGLDIGLTALVETKVVDTNITHNLSKMWREAGIYSALYESEGKTAKEVLPVLEQGLQDMTANPRKYRKFDSPNGWGTYEQALSWLTELITAFKKHPDGVVWINR